MPINVVFWKTDLVKLIWYFSEITCWVDKVLMLIQYT